MENQQFKAGLWCDTINVADFVKTNITPYLGDASFLCGPSERTMKVWNKCLEALEEESDESLRHQYPDLVDYAGNPMREVIAAEMAAEDLRMQSVALVDPVGGGTHWFHIA